MVLYGSLWFELLAGSACVAPVKNSTDPDEITRQRRARPRNPPRPTPLRPGHGADEGLSAAIGLSGKPAPIVKSSRRTRSILISYLDTHEIFS